MTDGLSRQQRRARARAEKKSQRRKRASVAALATAGALLAAGPAAAATFTVTNLNDSGPNSLRAAVTLANTTAGADSIVFQSGLTGTITLTTGELALTESLTISGPALPAAITISGNNASRILNVVPTVTTDNFSVSDLTFTAGNGTGLGGGGGAIRSNGGNLTLTRVTISNNTCLDSDGGGISFNGYYGNNLTITNSTISSNTAPNNFGGGLRVSNLSASVTVSGTTFSSNGAGYDGGGIDADIAAGGASLHVITSIITGNTAGTSAALSNVGAGGGIHINGYFTYGVAVDVLVRDTTVSGNTADQQIGGIGGGLSLEFLAGTLTVSQSTISGNTAALGGGFDLYQIGGPPPPATPAPIKIENSTIVNNTANACCGGGVSVYYSFTNIAETTITGNAAANGGGGVMVDTGGATITNSIIANNTATAGTQPDVGSAGGGTIAATYTLIKTPGTATIGGGTGNITGTDPALGPLGTDPGSPTATEDPLPGSPVINAGDPAFAPPPAQDQRHLPRVITARIDMGAVEVQPTDLSIAKTAVGSGPFFTTQNVQYQITVANAGPAFAGAVTVTDILPAGTTFVSATPSQGSCSGTTTVTCNLGTLNSGATATIALTVTLNTVGSTSNTANVSSTSPDTNMANNTSTATITVRDIGTIPALDNKLLILLAFMLASMGVWVAGKKA